MVFGFSVRLPASRWIHTVSHSSTVMCYSITITTYCCVCVDGVMELVVSSQVIKHTINKYSTTVTVRYCFYSTALAAVHTSLEET